MVFIRCLQPWFYITVSFSHCCVCGLGCGPPCGEVRHIFFKFWSNFDFALLYSFAHYETSLSCVSVCWGRVGVIGGRIFFWSMTTKCVTQCLDVSNNIDVLFVLFRPVDGWSRSTLGWTHRVNDSPAHRVPRGERPKTRRNICAALPQKRWVPKLTKHEYPSLQTSLQITETMSTNLGTKIETTGINLRNCEYQPE